MAGRLTSPLVAGPVAIIPATLALETSCDLCSVAVTLDDRLVAEHAFDGRMRLSERLMAVVDIVLREAELPVEQVGSIAVGVGPGSFTGTRIGVMSAKTLASALDIPAIGVSGLDALACETAAPSRSLIVPVIPCRADVVYTRAYEPSPDGPKPRGEISAMHISELIDMIVRSEPESVVACGPAVHRYQSRLEAALRESGVDCAVAPNVFPRAGTVARFAQDIVGRGRSANDPVSLVPLYVAPPPVTTPRASRSTPRS